MKAVIGLLMIVMLSGCMVRTEVVEDIYMALAMSVDVDRPGTGEGDTNSAKKEILLNLSAPLFTPSRKVEGVTFKERGATIKDTVSRINHESDQYLSISKLGIILFSKEVLRSGIGDHAEMLNADPLIAGGLIYGMTEGRAEDMLRAPIHTNNQPIGRYLCYIIENNIKTFDLPPMDIHKFIYEWKGAGMDPVMPIIGYHENRAALTGIAVMKGDKYVGQLTIEDMVPLNLMKKNTRDGSYVLLLNKNKITIQNLETKVKYEYKPGSKQFDIRLKIKGKLTQSDLSKTLELSRAQTAFNEQMTKQCEAIIAKLQKWDADPIGIGNIIRSKDRGWNEEEWRENYRSMSIKVAIETEMRR
ncbi:MULTISPECIES: Ger(x)C family spore germination protein [unclassified Paenibacillus]|uniref:Ger(x)C family spore germination protein n=1 Tax=unclassified Paenibacillus TaxID=185978 RepID=UPI0036D33D23